MTAITELNSRAIEAVASAEQYRELAKRRPGLRDFYHALAFTYERMAREANLMVAKVQTATAVTAAAA